MSSTSDSNVIYVGSIVTGTSPEENLVSPRTGLVVRNGIIHARGTMEEIVERYDGEIKQLDDNQILAPGFVDAHLHAPQYPNTGMHLNKPLLEWLKHHTFPLEHRYQDVEYAKRVYSEVVRSTLGTGTTTASYFGSIHKDSCVVLAREAEAQGQRAFVGKTNMDVNDLAPFYKDETWQTSLNDTYDFVNSMDCLSSGLTEPIITPRFALTCSMNLMKKLGDLAKQRNFAVQSHINENRAEIELAKQMFPTSRDYYGIYEDAGLFGKRALFAHSVHTTDEEYQRMAATGTSVIHCPSSNTHLLSGFFDGDVPKSYGVNIGLGTDISAAMSESMFEQIQMAEMVGKCNAINKSEDNGYVTYKQAYHWATLGGAKALGIESMIGSLEVGKKFDALLADVSEIPSVLLEGATPEEKFERFIRRGKKDCIKHVFVDGIIRC